MRFLNMKIDYVFKKVFKSLNLKDILLNFLNAILELNYPHYIKDPYNVSKLQGMG